MEQDKNNEAIVDQEEEKRQTKQGNLPSADISKYLTPTVVKSLWTNAMQYIMKIFLKVLQTVLQIKQLDRFIV